MKHSSRDCRPVARLLIALVLVCFALLPKAQAVVPAPDGGYPGFNTAEGTNALFSLTSGTWNTALGFGALKADTTGFANTATGYGALFFNTSGHHNKADGFQSLLHNTTGSFNTGSGTQTLSTNQTGNRRSTLCVTKR
jgi:hypothetical protein